VPRLDRWRWLPNASPATVKRLAIATLVANIALVVTGGAVRLTGSGLGCPTWPRCTSSSFVAHEALGVNGYIEFGNRMLTIVLTLISFVNWAAVMRLRSPRRDLRTLASVLLLAIPVQAVVGGISVLTKLNPWVVSCHLLASLAVIGLAVLLVCRIGEHPGPTRRVVPGPIALLSQLVFGVTCAVLYVGTVVTGSGPHAGSKEAPRNGLDPAAVSQLHADLVCILVGLTVGLVVALRAFRSAERIRRAARWLLGLELAQGIVGFTQYFTGLPIVLVGLHMLGAALISAAVTWVLLGMREPLVTPRVAPSSDV
jgi:cytochrome c oxidase assembly protein subunit 15